MALTKVTGQVINTSTDVTVGVLTVTNTLAVGGTVSIGGTLTYEDVTNIDSVGLITARNGIVVGSGITLSKDGDGFFTGVTTATTFVGALTGNVTGNINGDLTGTLQTAAQTNITSLGTLTSATISGDLTIADSIVHSGDTDTKIRFPSANQFTVETAGTERLKLDRSSDQSHLYVIGDDTGLGARLFLQNTNTTSGALSSVECLDQGGQSVSGVKFHINDHSNNEGFISMFIRPSGGSVTEALRIDSSGNIGVGVVPKTGQYSGYNHIQVGESGTLSSNDTQGDTNVTNLTNNVYLNNNASYWKYLHADEATRYQQYNGQHHFAVAASGSADANVSFSNILRIDSDGIKFNGDTAAANALDDYEEGTWTPTYLNLENAPTYGHRSGRYTKIGRFVHLVGQISVDSNLDNSDGSGVNIGGFPFTGNNAHGSALFTFGRYNTIMSDSVISSFTNVRFNGDGVMLQKGSSGTNNISYSQCNTSGHLQFAISYAL